MRLDPQIVQHQIANLAISYPDMVEDDWSLALASETDLDEMLTKLVRMIDDARALSEGTEGRLKELKERQDRFDRRIEAYRALILKLMTAANVRKLEMPEATLSIRPAQLRVIGEPDAEALPDDLVKIERRPDKAAIKNELLAGYPVPGCHLSNGGETLTIRVK